MPSNLNISFNDGDLIEADHVKQFADPVNDLESGRAFFAGASSGSSTAYTVSLSPPPESPQNDGMVLNFKAHVACGASPTLSVNGGTARNLVKNGGVALAANDIQANQIVSVILEGGSFHLVASASSGGGGATDLTGLSDVTINAPSTGQVLRKSAGDWVNATLTPSDIGAANASHQHSGADITSGIVAPANLGSGTPGSGNFLRGDGSWAVPGVSGNLNDLGDVTINAPSTGQVLRKSAGDWVNSSLSASDIGSGLVDDSEFSHLNGVTSNLQSQLDGKEPSFSTLPTSKGGLGVNAGSASGIPKFTSGAVSISNLAAGDMPSGIDAAKIGGGTVDNTEFGHLNGATGNLQSQIDGKEPSFSTLPTSKGGLGVNASSASGIPKLTSGAVSIGNLVAGDMPSGIDAAKIGGGTVDNTEFGHLNGATSNLQSQIDGKEPSFSTLPTNKGGLGVNAGSASGIPKFTSGAVSIGNLDASDMPSGIDAGKIGGGTVDNTEFGHLNGVTSGIQSQLDSKIPSSVLTQTGDLLFRDGSGPNRLPIGTAGQVLTVNSGATAPQWSNPVGPVGLMAGDGVDGNVTISSTVTLTRAMRYNNLTLASGGVLKPNGWPIYVAGTLSFEGGVISANGNDGYNGVFAGGATGGAGFGSRFIGGSLAGSNGGSGQNGNGTGAANGNGMRAMGGSSGQGGRGGAGSGGAGALTGQAQNPQNDPFGSTFNTHLNPTSLMQWPNDRSSVELLVGGCSGSGGGGGGGNGSQAGAGAGGGGAGGGCVALYANTVDFTNSGGSYSCILARGGNGGPVATTFTPSGSQRGGGGGGGAGGGGVVVAYLGSVVGSCTEAIDVSGGSGGDGGNASAGSSGSTRGGQGGQGAYSGRVMVYIQSTNTWIVSGSGGNTDSPGPSSPTVPTNQTGTAGTAGVTRKVSL